MTDFDPCAAAAWRALAQGLDLAVGWSSSSLLKIWGV